jgi:hypothetical protein
MLAPTSFPKIYILLFLKGRSRPSETEPDSELAALLLWDISQTKFNFSSNERKKCIVLYLIIWMKKICFSGNSLEGRNPEGKDQLVEGS